MDDWRRLKQYARDGSEAAFAELIRQHMDLVYSVCQREVGDTMLAEEATQAVFLVLAQKAGSLRQEAALASWLFTTARLTSRSILRRERRRQRREEKAVVEAVIEMEQATPPETPRWEEAEPLLNDALSTLSAAQRSLIILRFWEDRPLADIGHSLGISEDAARMRLNRALDRLRRWLSARSVVLSAAALAAGLPLAVRPAPARCAEALTRLPLPLSVPLSAAFPASLTAQGTIHTMNLTRLMPWLIIAPVTVALVTAAVSFLSPHKGIDPLTVDAGLYLLSPDGRYCLGTQITPQAKLHLIDLQTTQTQQLSLAHLDPVNVTWGRDSRSVLTTSYSDVDKESIFYSANVSGAADQHESFRLKDMQPIGLSLSPNGKSLAFSNHLDQSRFCVYDTETKSLVPVPSQKVASGAGEFSWSADGQDVAFAAKGPGRTASLAIYDVPSNTVKTIGFDADSIALSPDGKSIAAVSLKSYPTPRATVAIISSATGQTLRSINYPVSVAGRMLWSKDSQVVYFVSQFLEKQPHVESLDAASGQQKTLIKPQNCSVLSLIGIRGSTLYYSTADDMLHSQLSQTSL